jgi:outer membrane protein assembly factor BamB
MNAAHTGAATLPNLRLPYAPKWFINLGAGVSYPLIGGGRTFVTVSQQVSGIRRLVALDLATGVVQWDQKLGGWHSRISAAYDSGRVFAINAEGLLRAFDAATGALLWSRQLSPSYSFDSAPTVHGGVVYTLGAGVGGYLYAVRASDGQLLWSTEAGAGQQCAPAVTDEGVYLVSAGPHVFKLDPQTGQLLWETQPDVLTGGGSTPVYADGRLYIRDERSGTRVLDAQTGEALFPDLPNGLIPAVDGDRFFSVSFTPEGAGKLTAYRTATHEILWSRPLEDAPVLAPVVVNGDVLLGVGTELRAYAGASGALLWADALPASVAYPDERNVSSTLTGLGAGEDTLLVPAGEFLVAYRTGNLGTAAELSGEPGANHWFRGPVRVTLHVRRGSSTAIAGTYFQLDGSKTKQYTEPFTVQGEAIHRLVIWSRDTAGQREPRKTVQIPIDPTAPKLRLRASPSHLTRDPHRGQKVRLRLQGKGRAAAVDPGSVRYQVVDEYGHFPEAGPMRPTAGGAFVAELFLSRRVEQGDPDGRRYDLRVTGKDLAGNPFTVSSPVQIR